MPGSVPRVSTLPSVTEPSVGGPETCGPSRPPEPGRGKTKIPGAPWGARTSAGEERGGVGL
eukprot:9195795-Pyramimonas_sp.AAC.1